VAAAGSDAPANTRWSNAAVGTLRATAAALLWLSKPAHNHTIRRAGELCGDDSPEQFEHARNI
jgi:hypothetical protein